MRIEEMVYKFSNITGKVNPVEPPCKKKIYYSLQEAQDMIAYINENRVAPRIHAYKCNICGFWHLTSKSIIT